MDVCSGERSAAREDCSRCTQPALSIASGGRCGGGAARCAMHDRPARLCRPSLRPHLRSIARRGRAVGGGEGWLPRRLRGRACQAGHRALERWAVGRGGGRWNLRRHLLISGSRLLRTALDDRGVSGTHLCPASATPLLPLQGSPPLCSHFLSRPPCRRLFVPSSVSTAARGAGWAAMPVSLMAQRMGASDADQGRYACSRSIAGCRLRGGSAWTKVWRVQSREELDGAKCGRNSRRHTRPRQSP